MNHNLWKSSVVDVSSGVLTYEKIKKATRKLSQPTVHKFKKTPQDGFRLEISTIWIKVYHGNNLVNAYGDDWVSNDNPKFRVLELLF